METNYFSGPCTYEDIRYNERQYHSYPVDKDGVPLDVTDEAPHIEPDHKPFSCSRHGEDFDVWPQVLAHMERWATKRLEELRLELRAEHMSYAELAELQSLAGYITPGDVELLEAAGVPEFEEE